LELVHKLISHLSSTVGIIRKIPDFNSINSGRVTEIDVIHASASCSNTKGARQKKIPLAWGLSRTAIKECVTEQYVFIIS